jgi:hypothetical protein
MSLIDDWEFPPPERCEVCGELVRNHWRGKPCLKEENEEKQETLGPLTQLVRVTAF